MNAFGTTLKPVKPRVQRLFMAVRSERQQDIGWIPQVSKSIPCRKADGVDDTCVSIRERQAIDADCQRRGLLYLLIFLSRANNVR